MKNISNISFKGKRVLVRVDFNVPLDSQYNITDDSRIRAALICIKTIISSGGSAVIMSHLGRPRDGYEIGCSLKHLVSRLTDLLKTPVSFCKSCIGEDAFKKSMGLKQGEVLLLENLRFHAGEKLGDISFARELSTLGDAYVNNAFGTAHRKHASTSTICQFFKKTCFFGPLLASEIKNLDRVVSNAKKPLTAIIGGAKITGKIDVIKSLFKITDNVIIGGGMAYTFIKALGGQVGMSILEKEKINLAKELVAISRKNNVTLFLPNDSINASAFNNNAKILTSDIYNIPKGYMGLDIGPKSVEVFASVISRSRTIVWNGPMGVFEMSNFKNGTKKIGEAIAMATKNGAFSLVGGGDSVAALKLFNLSNKVSYVSTGGGAMLDYLEGKKLPGVSALED